ncbi:MAG: glycosyltransferase family 1 protein [Saprospiraceae bacterium]|nr:glycosyltransferase family 1 protein [Saprospiraceae bacterium]
MPTIALEMERLRNPYSGLGQYCLQLGHAFLPAIALAKEGSAIALAKEEHEAMSLEFACLVPAERMGEFGNGMTYKAVKPWHKIIGPSFGESLWHCMHQDSEYMPRSRKTPLAITIHDLNFLDRPDYSEAKKSRRLKAMQQKINRAKGLVYISEYVQKWVRKHLEVPVEMVERVIYNGGSFKLQVESVKFQASSVQGPPSFGKPTAGKTSNIQDPFLFSIGIHPKKNYHVLMPLLAENKEFKWIIAGPDSRGYKAKIEQEAARYGVSDRIEFCGPVGDEAKLEYYKNSTALLFPSLSEGFGLPVVEAMSLGKPVFLSDRTSLPEIGGSEAYYFKDFEPQTLIETFSAGLKDFNNDPDKPKRMKAWASQFTWEKAADQYIEFYQQLLTVDH